MQYQFNNLIIWQKKARLSPPSSQLLTLSKFINLFLVFFLLTLNASTAIAADKTWKASADETDWHTNENWYPALVPTALDDTTINSKDATAVVVSETFNVKSLTLSGNEPSTLSIENFVTGNIIPASSSGVALHNRKGGHLFMKGSAGVVTAKGSYKSSEEGLAPQPSLVFSVQ